MPLKMTVYTSGNCSYCDKAKKLLSDLEIPFEEIAASDAKALFIQKGWKTVPQIMLDEVEIGGFDQLEKYLSSKHVVELLKGKTIATY